ncbi:hypothetical protein IAR55_000490 [Kwoniella newhampshirensis]|uniref:acylphosphatase n=1 Tax=Kwoniella newhampshirensis TaxID=1651941 RepID=A0AAW0Z6R6_9TREE
MSEDLIQFRVTGQVQGVNFRYYTQKEAQKLGLRGHCYNHDDSSVQGVAVGPEDKVKQFRLFLQKGPSAAEVHSVDLIKECKGAGADEIEKALEGTKGFEVKR